MFNLLRDIFIYKLGFIGKIVYLNCGAFFAKPPHTPKNLNGFSCVAVEFEQTPLNFAQIEH